MKPTFLDTLVSDEIVVPVDQVLDGGRELLEVVVIGLDINGKIQVAGSHSTAHSVLLLERGIAKIIQLLEE